MNIKDIAKLCGVSTATISRVLNNNPHVREETRERVLAIMAEHGYTPNAFARGLGLGSMRIIGILCTNIDDLYYSKAVSLVEASLREQGFDMLLCCTGSKLEDKKKCLAMLLEKRVDAIVLIGSAFREEKDNSHIRAAAKRVPVVIVNGLVAIPGVYCVLCDEKEAMQNNVRLLYGRGSRHILYVYDTLTFSGMQKLSGYREGLKACGLEEQAELLVKVSKNIDEAQTAVAGLLERRPDIDAVLASEDLLAVGAQKAMAVLGRAIPLIGFNNSRYAQCTFPALTSVDNMLDTLCPTAVGLLMDVLNGKGAPAKIVVSGMLIERETFRT